MRARSTAKQRPAGFSLLETMAAILVLSFGILALAAVYTQGITYMNSAEFEFIAQQKAAEAIETIFTARDTRVLTWDQIRNVVDAGIFLDGQQPLLASGPDGLLATVDDDVTDPDKIVKSPGPDNLLGTADDEVIQLLMFTREIRIRDIAPNLRQIDVVVRYRSGRLQRQVSMTSYISSFS